MLDIDIGELFTLFHYKTPKSAFSYARIILTSGADYKEN
jgi:hypothetical protein